MSDQGKRDGGGGTVGPDEGLIRMINEAGALLGEVLARPSAERLELAQAVRLQGSSSVTSWKHGARRRGATIRSPGWSWRGSPWRSRAGSTWSAMEEAASRMLRRRRGRVSATPTGWLRTCGAPRRLGSGGGASRAERRRGIDGGPDPQLPRARCAAHKGDSRRRSSFWTAALAIYRQAKDRHLEGKALDSEGNGARLRWQDPARGPTGWQRTRRSSIPRWTRGCSSPRGTT